jgi:hypothetical protein
MKFAYRRFLAELFDGESLSDIYRPIVPVFIHGPRDSLLIRPLLDSGADFTLLPLSVATAIGVDLDMDRIGTVGGIEGGSLATYSSDVEFELNDGNERYRWSATVRFAAGNNMLLGHLGFLEFLIATLDHHNRTFSLEPGAGFPV